MNRALLAELQQQRCYPSITLLLATTSGVALSASQRDTATELVREVERRLAADAVDEATATDLVARLRHLVDDVADEPATHGLAVFVSPEYSATVRLGRAVDARVAIDDTFATRDLVADLNRTALYRVVTISERVVRVFIGDRQRLVEQRDDVWPLQRDEHHTTVTWMRDLNQLLRREHASYPLPTVLAGVQRSVRELAPHLTSIGFVAGNHDRSSASQLHHLAWPLVVDWLRTDETRALARLDQARSTNRYAGGIHEVWSLANEGRVDTIVVENGFRLPARIGGNHELLPADDPHHPEVNDDIVDDTIESVLLSGGNAVIVSDGALADVERVAAILRY
jgi:hypothetical protein